MRVLIADKFEREGVEAMRASGHEVEVRAELSPETLPGAIREFRPDVLVVRSTKVPAGVIAQSGGIRAIIRAGAGVDNIDVSAASAAGIPVANCPGMNSVAVAELAMGHIIACDRRLCDQTIELRQGRWNKQEFSKARGLKGRTLGVVGVGAIGSALIARARAFEMPIIAWSRGMDADRARELGVTSGGSTRADLLAMLPRCDAVSVHVSLDPSTRKLCDDEFFGAMREGAIFVNTSRGAIVDSAALARAVREKKLRVGLDVYEDQPAEKQCDYRTDLADLPGACLTHHCGASTDQAQWAVAEETARLVDVLARTGRLENCVNEAMLAASPRA